MHWGPFSRPHWDVPAILRDVRLAREGPVDVVWMRRIAWMELQAAFQRLLGHEWGRMELGETRCHECGSHAHDRCVGVRAEIAELDSG